MLPIAINKLRLNKKSFWSHEQNQILTRLFHSSPQLRYPDDLGDQFDAFPDLQPSLWPDDGGPVDNDGHILMQMRRDIEEFKPEFNQTWLEPISKDKCKSENNILWVLKINDVISKIQSELGPVHKEYKDLKKLFDKMSDQWDGNEDSLDLDLETNYLEKEEEFLRLLDYLDKINTYRLMLNSTGVTSEVKNEVKQILQLDNVKFIDNSDIIKTKFTSEIASPSENRSKNETRVVGHYQGKEIKNDLDANAAYRKWRADISKGIEQNNSRINPPPVIETPSKISVPPRLSIQPKPDND